MDLHHLTTFDRSCLLADPAHSHCSKKFHVINAPAGIQGCSTLPIAMKPLCTHSHVALKVHNRTSHITDVYVSAVMPAHTDNVA